MPKLYRWAFKRILNEFALVVPKDSKVLDFACATSYRYRVHFKHCSYVGADICFKEKYRKVDENTELVYADFNENPFEDNSFDAIISTNSINYSGDESTIIKNLNVLIDKCKKENGVFITNVNESYSDNLKKEYLATIQSRFNNVTIRNYQGKVAMFFSKCVDWAYVGNEQVNRKYKDPVFSRLWAVFMIRITTPIIYHLFVRHFDFYDKRSGLMVLAQSRIN